MLKLIIDTNVIHIVINPDHSEYYNFKPLIKYLINRKAIWLYGGEVYKNELKEHGSEKKRNFFLNLKKINAFIDLERDIEIKDWENHCYSIQRKTNKFDDAHIIAICVIGELNLVCTYDDNSNKFIKDKRFYPRNFVIPFIYKNLKHLKSTEKLCNACFYKKK